MTDPRGFFVEDYELLQAQIVASESRLCEKLESMALKTEEGFNRVHEVLEGPSGMFVRLDRVEQQMRLIAGGMLLGVPLAIDWIKKHTGWSV